MLLSLLNLTVHIYVCCAVSSVTLILLRLCNVPVDLEEAILAPGELLASADAHVRVRRYLTLKLLQGSVHHRHETALCTAPGAGLLAINSARRRCKYRCLQMRRCIPPAGLNDRESVIAGAVELLCTNGIAAEVSTLLVVAEHCSNQPIADNLTSSGWMKIS